MSNSRDGLQVPRDEMGELVYPSPLEAFGFLATKGVRLEGALIIGNVVLILAAGIAGYVIAVSTRGTGSTLVGVQYRSSTGAIVTAWLAREEVHLVNAPGAPQAPQAPHPPQPPNAGGGGHPGQGHPAQHRPAYPPPNQYHSIAPPPALYGAGQSQYGYPAPQGYYPPGYNGSNAG